MDTTIEQLRAEFQAAFNALQAEVNTLRSENASLRATLAAPPVARPRQQLPEPTKFDGKTHHFRTWLPAIRAKIRVDGQAIGQDTARFYYVYSNLEPQVQAMVLPQLAEAEKQKRWDYSAILDQLSRVYSNPNQRQEAEDALHHLRQTDKEHLPAYLAKFERLLYEAEAQDWPDSVKISTLRSGLNSSIRKALATQLSLPASYSGFLRMVQQLSRRQLIYTYDSHSQQQQSGDKMDIGCIEVGALQRAPIPRSVTPPTPTRARSVSPSQRYQWRQAGNCVRCGSNSHWVSQCTQLPTILKRPQPKPETSPTRQRSSPSASSPRSSRSLTPVHIGGLWRAPQYSPSQLESEQELDESEEESLICF